VSTSQGRESSDPLVHLSGRGLAEPESMGEANSRNVIGVPIVRAESLDAKKERLAETIDQRAEVSGEWVDQMREALDTSGGAGIPEKETYLQQARQYRDYNELQQVKRQATQPLWELQRDPSIFKDGRLTDDGRAKLCPFATWIWALDQR
jgi:hypothetical protein